MTHSSDAREIPTGLPGLSWKKFVLELPVPISGKIVQREFEPLADTPMSYFAHKALAALTPRVAPDVRRDVGRALAAEARPDTVESFLAAFAAAGLGHIGFEHDKSGRYVYSTDDGILEAEASRMPACNMVLGFVEALTAAATGGAVLGSEVTCRSMGHERCTFVVMPRT